MERHPLRSGLVPLFRPRRSSARPCRFRQARLEWLEPRVVLAAPTLAIPVLPAGDPLTLYSGATLHLGLDGFDADDGDTITYKVTITNSTVAGFTAVVPEGNDSLRISAVWTEDGVEQTGDMVFELYDDLAPETAARIKELAENSFYDKLTFHRIEEISDGDPETAIIQGGDPNGDGSGGSELRDIDDEFNPDARHTGIGDLAMAKNLEDTNNSQFFITAGRDRFLDFHHTVVGHLSEGEDVRAAIQAQSPPVLMDTVTVFPDTENGLLRLSAPEGTSGTATVTVVAKDSTGAESAPVTFDVTITPDTENDQPYLLPIDLPAGALETTGRTPVEFDLQGTDVEGDPMYYWAWPLSQWPPSNTNDPSVWEPFLDSAIDVDVNAKTGHVVVTPQPGAAGVHGVLVWVTQFDSQIDEASTNPALLSSYGDLQFVPLVINPDTPTGIELVNSDDTGASQDDHVTRRNNDGTDSTLQFRVFGTVAGAEVTVFADGQEIGSATATGATTDVISNGQLPLSDGTHQITASQSLTTNPVTIGNGQPLTVDQTTDESAPREITVDTDPPEFLSSPVTDAAEGAFYEYQVETAVEAGDTVTYRLTAAPAGMNINSQSGRITWKPGTDQAGTRSVTVRATDLAGNTSDQSFDIGVADAPELDPIADKTVNEGSLVTFTATATGGEGTLSFSLDAPPDGAAIDASTGEFNWTPGEAQGGTGAAHSIRVRVTDSVGATSVKTVKVAVNEVNTPPVLESIGGQPFSGGPVEFDLDEGVLLDVAAVASDADLPANALEFELVDPPAGAAIDPETGRFTWQPDPSQGGTDYDLTVRVWDEGFTPDEATFTVHVRDVGDPLPPATTPSALAVALADAAAAGAASSAFDVPAVPSLSLSSGGQTFGSALSAASQALPPTPAATGLFGQSFFGDEFGTDSGVGRQAPAGEEQSGETVPFKPSRRPAEELDGIPIPNQLPLESGSTSESTSESDHLDPAATDEAIESLADEEAPADSPDGSGDAAPSETPSPEAIAAG